MQIINIINKTKTSRGKQSIKTKFSIYKGYCLYLHQSFSGFSQ